MRALLRPAVFLIALGAACFVLVQSDLPRAWRSVCAHVPAGTGMVLAAFFLVPAVLAGVLDTWGWIATRRGSPVSVSFPRFFSIRLAGEALNQITPLLPVSGDAVKAALLAGDGVPVTDGGSSVLAARLMLHLAQITYVLGALLLATGRHWPNWRTPLVLGALPVVFGGLIASVLGSRLLLPAGVRRRMRLHPWVARHIETLRVIQSAFDFWHEAPWRFWVAFACFLAGWVVIAGEFWVAAHFLDLRLSWRDALVLEGLMNSVTMATFFVPGNLGSQEAGLVYLSDLFGLGKPFGAVMVVLRRAREVFWIALGLACLAILGARAGGGAAAGRLASEGEL